MGNYLDKDYAAIDGILLSYCGNNSFLNIPKKLANMELTKIGDGAFYGMENLKEVVIPYGITQIGREAFDGCKNLNTISIPGTVNTIDYSAFGLYDIVFCSNCFNYNIFGYRISKSEYQNLMSSSLKVDKTLYITQSLSKKGVFKDLLSSINIDAADRIQYGVGRILTSHDEKRDAANMKRYLNVFYYDGSRKALNETDEFMRIVRENKNIVQDMKTEKNNDLFLKEEKYPTIRKTAIFYCDDSKTKIDNGEYSIDVNIMIGYHFWQSFLPIAYENKVYYLYIRNYLTDSKEMNYIRRDTAIFSDKGLVEDKQEAQQIYAKYKLLSIL